MGLLEEVGMKCFNIDEAATVLRVSPRSLADRRYRLRLGLTGRKIGRRLIFTEKDLARLLEEGREILPCDERREGQVT